MQICATQSIVIITMPAPAAKREVDWMDVLKFAWAKLKSCFAPK